MSPLPERGEDVADLAPLRKTGLACVQAAGRQRAYHIDQARITLLQDELRALVPSKLALPLCALLWLVESIAHES